MGETRTGTNDQLLERLDAADLDGEVETLVLAAALGDHELAQALGGDMPQRPAPGTEGVAPPHLYLADITVEGFRGIGSEARLGLTPGAGLTLVVGRNGSGKSSFAEAAELVLSGRNQRWQDRPAMWKKGWRNLHHDGPARLALRLQVGGSPGFTTVTTEWVRDARLDDSTTAVRAAGGSGDGTLPTWASTRLWSRGARSCPMTISGRCSPTSRVNCTTGCATCSASRTGPPSVTG